jgi:hypothetical protein
MILFLVQSYLYTDMVFSLSSLQDKLYAVRIAIQGIRQACASPPSKKTTATAPKNPGPVFWRAYSPVGPLDVRGTVASMSSPIEFFGGFNRTMVYYCQPLAQVMECFLFASFHTFLFVNLNIIFSADSWRWSSSTQSKHK